MNRIEHPTSTALRRRSADAVRLGYVPLIHAAPLLAAQHQGLFARHGLRVRLGREVGWATVREKILSGELDAAQALAPMPLAMTLGLNSARADCLTALVLNLHGNAIVFSHALWAKTGGEPAALRSDRGPRPGPATFAVVYPHSAQFFLLRDWLDQAGLVPTRDYRLVVVPPPQMVNHLKAGHLDGFCVGEPWASMAVRSRAGVIAALSCDLAPGHAEKVLLVRRAFAEEQPGTHAALVRALFEACRWCADPANRDELVGLLAHRDGLGLPPEVLRPALSGAIDLGAGRSTLRPDMVVFHGHDANAPSPDRIGWLASRLVPHPSPVVVDHVYRLDLHRSIVASLADNPPSHASPIPQPEFAAT